MIGMFFNLLVFKYCDYFVWIYLLFLNKFISDYFICIKYCECKKKVRIFLNFYSWNFMEFVEGFLEVVFGF